MSEKKKDTFHRFTQEEINNLPGRELKSRRTRSSKTYSLGNGLYQAVVYPEAVHYRNEKGEWEDIDHTLQQAEGSFHDHSGDLAADLGPGGCVTLHKGEHTLSWQIVGANAVEPAVENAKCCFPRHNENCRVENKVTYANIFPDVDFVCDLKPNQFKDTLIFKTPSALRPVKYMLRAEGLVLHQAASGAVVAMCGDDIIFRLPAPCVVDESGSAVPDSARAVLTKISNTEWSWVCTVDAVFAASATFPIRLDPIVETQESTNGMDMAYTASGKPTTNYPGTGYSVRVATGNATLGKCSTYLKFHYDPNNPNNSALPTIDSSYYVTSATLTMRTVEDSSSVPVYVKEVLSAWDPAAITFNTAPDVQSDAMEYCIAPTAKDKNMYFNITNLVRKWYNGTNHGLMLETLTNSMVHLGGIGASFAKPYITINYVSLAGLEDYLVQDSISCNRAGSAHVGLFNGNLVFSHQETSMNGNLAPVSISRYYNSCYRDINPFGVGKGWQLSVHQTLHKETIDSSTYYVYMDGDGTRHHFKQQSGEWKDLSGLEFTLSISDGLATITDKVHNKMVFEEPTTEFDGNYANVKKLTSGADAFNIGPSFEYGTDGLLTTVRDGANRATQIMSTNGMITSIQAPDMPAVSYTYENEHLVQITHPDGKTTSYSYNAHGLLESIENHDGTAVLISYYPVEPFRVMQITQLANKKIYAARKYSYGDCCTTITELIPTTATQNTALSELKADLVNERTMFVTSNTGEVGKSLHYHFNDAGNLVSINDELGYGCFAGYSDDVPTNHPAFVSKMQRSVNNYLKNHHFLTVNNTDWIGDLMDGAGECSYNSEMTYAGGRAYRLLKTSDTGTISVYQNVTLKKNRSYTFSCQYKTLNSANVQLRVEWEDSNDNPHYEISPAFACTDRWNRTHISFTLPDDAAAQNVTVRIMATGGAGKVWADAAQLEDGLVPNRYNLLENPNFYMNDSGCPQYWYYSSDVEADDGVTTEIADGRPTELTGNVLRLKGACGKNKYVVQEMSCIGSKDDTFVAGGWSFSHCCPRNEDTPVFYEMEVRARELPEEGATKLPEFITVGRVRWSEEWSGWQFAAIPIVMPWDYTAVQVRLVYRNNLNEAQFSNLFLHKEEFGKTFAYDENGNVTSVKNLAALQSGSEYDDFDNLISYHQPGRNEEYTLHWGSTDDDKKKHLLRSTTSPLNIIQRTKYDAEDSSNTEAKGLPVENSVENAAGTMKIISKTTYTDDNNYVRQQTDARNQTITTETHADRGTVSSVTDPKGQTVSYEYDTLGRVTKVSATVSPETSSDTTKIYQNKYTYTNDKLTEVAHNTTNNTACDVAYHFEYDDQNRRTKVKVGNQLLSENKYSSAPDASYGTLTQMAYGNGDTVNYGYDDFKRMTSMQYGTDASKKFSYEYGANGQVARVTNHELNRTVLSEHDSCNRPMRITHLSGTEHLYTGEVTYDAYNNLHTFEEQVGDERTAYSTTFSYDVENKPTQLQYDATNKVAYTYDNLGRVKKRTVTLNGTPRSATYAYVDGGHGENSTTNLVQKITQTGGTFTYEYDDNGNITSVMQANYYVTYAYDALGQLIRVNDQLDKTSGSSGTTWVFEYDRGGNILKKKRYAYKDPSVAITDSTTVKETITYTYGNANWKDQLTAVNGVGITYDAIGNPLNDGTWTYTWEKGRQLKRMQSVDIDASFVYNENGLRIRKTVNGVVTDYTLHGKNIVHMTQGNDTLHFYYDASNRPAMVEYNGVKYTYIYNLQSDVVALLDSNGTAVVKYRYDAWGKPTSKTGDLASTLGTVQPFRYRGYVYDEETGLYYLRSRYYSYMQSRFIDVDSFIVIGHNKAFQNGMTYCDNNPICFSDPTGHIPALFLYIGGCAVMYLAALIAPTYNSVEHYERNDLNQTDLTIDEIIETYDRQPEHMDTYHENTDGKQGADAVYNDKFLSPNGGHIEVIICFPPDEEPYIVDETVDERNMGTYNHASNEIPGIYHINHFFDDMVPYYLFGNTPEDSYGLFK